MSNPVETLAAPTPEPEGRMGPITRARASLTAIEVLLRLREDQAAPTEEDLAALRHWPGWGPLAPALAPNREGTWAEIGEQLQQLLSTREYRQAEQGTPTAYYTPGRVADACWTALRDLGFRGGRLLEPGCGAGTFIGRTPDRVDVEWFGVERDPTTAGIAALLHPDAQIVNARFQDAAVQSNSVDAVLGNVPYGNFAVHDKTAPKQVTDSIHNYFIWRSVQALRPGGVAILLTSRYTMDSQDDDARRAIAKHADLLGAIRLPNGALAEGGTGVLADILILRRRDTDGPLDESWMGTRGVPGVPDQECNDYFINHPEHVLGTFEQGRAAQYGHTLAVKAPEDQDLTAALAGAFDNITAAARNEGREWRVAVGAQPFTEDTLPFPVRDDGRKEGSFHLVDNVPHEVVDGELVAVQRAGKELPKLIALRDATLRLIEAETNYDTPDDQLEPLRADVNFLYDRYVQAHGPINRYTKVEGEVDEETGEASISRRYPRLGGFRRDPDFVAVLALEDYDDETQVASKAALLNRRVNRRVERPTSASTPEEALSLCLNFTNKVDTAVIASLLGIEQDQVPGALGELVFADPDTGDLVTTGEYLSGPVVDKLERAEFLLSQGREDLQRHVDALREVQPEPLEPEDIRAKLGAPWIPADDVVAFAEDLLGVHVDITHIAKTATWSVDLPMTVPEAATSEWGTARVNAFELLDLALNGQAPKVYDTFKVPDGGTRRVRNDQQTLLAETKLTDLARRFASWVWEDPDRADRLATHYNRVFNSTVLRKHDGSHLTVDGLDPEFDPYEHQWDFVQRVLSAEEGSLCPYPVGAGKTATMFMTALKLKQLGLVNKPMIVVPNHLLEQIARDGKKLFQNSQILMAGKKDLADARSRMLFAARVATGDWDAIVMTHNSFGRLGVHPITEATYLEELANEYREALSVVDADDNPRRIKEIAKQVDRFDARASDLRSKAVDAGVTFENLGVDFLQVDEAHLFKNLALPAVTEGMSLGKPSKRATDLDLKIITTRERTGRDNVTALYSGTFISNSVRELYVFEHYTMPKRLEKLGLGSADAWAANHIVFESKPEVGVDGVSFRLKRRPVEYCNADEALAVFQEVAELRPREAFKIERPKRVDRFVEIEATPNLISYVSSISDRIDLIESGKVKPWEDNMLNVITDGRKAALDLELVGVEPDGPGKARTIAKNVLQVYHRTKDLEFPNGVTGGLQLVFCDLGTPSKKKGSQVYGKIRRYLIDGLPGETLEEDPTVALTGIPRERIKFIHDYNSDLAKEQLFSDSRAGKVSVLFMSSEKGGTGVNVQPLAVALHHADPPHKPAEWEQREGRVDRPGNLLIKLDLPAEFYRYIALNSFDSYMFQQLERKQRPIVQIMSGRKVGRVIQEIDPVGAGFGQAKAIATGNPLLMELADANGELTVLLNAADGHRQSQSRMRRKAEVLSDQIRDTERALPAVEAMAAAVTADEMWRTADGRLVDADDVPGALAQAAQGSKPTLDLTTGYTWRGVNVGFTFHRRQQFGGVTYESWAHLVAGGREVDVRLNLSWFGKGQAWRIVKALGDAADEAVLAPGEIHRKLDKWRAALEDTQSHLGRPFDKHAQLEAVRERKAALEGAIASNAIAAGRESQSGPQFDPGASAAGEMSLTDMAMHDAAAMAGMLGGTAVVISEGQFIGGARLIDSTTLPDNPHADLTEPWVKDQILRALTQAAAADSDVVAWAQIDANEGAPFREGFEGWAQDWAIDRAQEISAPEDRPVWLRAYLDFTPEAFAERQRLVADAAEIVWRQARATPAPQEAGSAAQDRLRADAQQDTAPSPSPDPTGAVAGPQPATAAAAERLTDPQLWEEGLRTLTAGAAGVERLELAARVNDAGNFGLVFSDWAENWVADRYSGSDTAGWPQWARLYFGGGEQAFADRAQLHRAAAATAYAQLRAADTTPAPEAPAPEAERLQDLIDGFGGRVMVGHIGGPSPARTHQSAGWAITAVLNEVQVRGLVSAVAVDNQPVDPESGTAATDRVREWVAEQQQAPTAAFYASTSTELPPAWRGDGDVSLSTRGDGLSIEQGETSTTIAWEELPAWIDAAVAYDTANHPANRPAWRYGPLDREIHFRRDERNRAIRTAMDALAGALRETAPPTDEQLAAARARFAPPAAPAADTVEDVPAEESAPPEPEEQQLPEDATPVPGAEGYFYATESRTVWLYTEAGEEVGTARWNYGKGRYLGDVNGDTVRGTEDGATIAKRMANHHAVVYGDQVHRPQLDDQGRDPVWILHNASDTLVFGIQPEDDTARAALWTGSGFKESRKVGGWYLPRTWKAPTRKERVDTAIRVLTAAGRTVTVHASREGRQRTQRPARLPELAVTAPDLDQVPQLFAADPFVDDADMAAAVERLDDAHERWSQHPTAAAYITQDYGARPNGFGRPDNPIAELRFAHLYAVAGLRNGPVSGGADEVVRRIYAVAAWAQALEPAVDTDLLDPLQEVYAAAYLLAARSQASVVALLAEQSAAAAAEETPAPAAEETPAAEQPQPDTGDQVPGPGTADPGEPETAEPASEQPEAPPAAAADDDGQLVEPAPAPSPDGTAAEEEAAETAAPELTATPDTEPDEQPDLFTSDDDGAPAPQDVPQEPEATPPAVTDTPASDASATADTPAETDDAPASDATVADEEDGQLDLFGEAAPAPAAAQRPGRRRGQSEPEPAVSPGTADGPRDGRVGVYGHAGRGECERCGTADTDRYTVVLHWFGPDHGEMASECGSCVELTTGLAYQQYQRLADTAEARRGGLRITPQPHPDGEDVTVRRTADNEWTSVHRPAGQRYRTFKESESGYRGFVTRDLVGVSQGTGVSVNSIRDVTERAALGRTAETHPTDSDDWVFFSYRDAVRSLVTHAGETITAHDDASRRRRAPLEHGPRWDLSIGDADFTVEMVYQQGLPGEDGHRLEVTDVGDTSVRHTQWQGVLDWARERTSNAQRTAAPTVAPLAAVEETLAAAEDIRSNLQRTSVSSALVQAREAWDAARTHYDAGRLAEGDRHLTAARSHAILARVRESSHADFRPLKDAVRRFHDAVDEVLYPGGAGWRPAADDYVRSRHLYLPDSEGFWMQVVAIENDGIRIRSGMTGERETVVQPTDIGPHGDLPWQEQPFRAPGEARASDQGRRAHLALPPETALDTLDSSPAPAEPEPAPAPAVSDDEEELTLFSETAPATTVAPPAPDTAVPGEEPAPADAATVQDGQLPLSGPADVAPAPDPASADDPDTEAAAEPAATAEPIAAPTTGATTQDAPEPDREADPGKPEPTTDRGDMATPPSTADTVPVEDPPEPQQFTDITPLAADPAYELHLTGLDGQDPTAGELRHGGTTIAAVRLSADGRWFSRMAVDGMPADVTALNRSPQEAAHQGAVLFSVFTQTPYGEQPQAADADGPLSRADRLRADLRDSAQQHLGTITAAASRVRVDYPQIPQFQELSTRLTDLSAAVAEGHGSRQMAANLTAVQEAVNAWGGALPDDAALDERQFLAWPLAHLLYDTSRLHGRLQATLDAVQAERAARAEQQAAASAEPAAEPEAVVSPQPDPVAEPARERVQGPAVTLGLRATDDGEVVVRVETGEIAHAVVLPGVTTGVLPDQSLPATAEVPLLIRPAGQEHQLLGDEETERWLAGHLDRSPLAPAWRTAAARVGLVVVVRDALRDQAAPSVDDIADWLVETATEQDGLWEAAHTAGSVDAFASAFGRSADAQMTEDGSEHLMWRYFGDDGARREAVLALAVERAHERLLAEDEPPLDASAPEQVAAPQPAESAAPRPDVPEDPEMATPARPATPERREAADRDPAPAGDLPLWADPADVAEPTDDGPLDVVAEFAAVQEAWDEHVPASQGTGEDLFASVEEHLARLEALFADTVAKRTPAPEPQTAPEAAPATTAPAAVVQPPPAPAEPEATQKDGDPQQRASAVNTALREADAHAPSLQDMPEWQRIQTLRGAFGNLMRVIRERAGEHLNNLLNDGRVGEFLRRASIRVCETIAKWAQAGADWLRKGGELPSAEALLRLGDAAYEYRGPRRGPGGNGAPASPAGDSPTVVDVPAMRAMGEALSRPMPGATKRVSTAAARGRSTTTKRAAKKTTASDASGTEQAGHLRRTGTEQPQPRKPTR